MATCDCSRAGANDMLVGSTGKGSCAEHGLLGGALQEVDSSSRTETLAARNSGGGQGTQTEARTGGTAEADSQRRAGDDGDAAEEEET